MSMMVQSGRFGGAIPGVTYDIYWQQVVLLLGFNGSDGSTSFTDESYYAHAMTAVGDAQIDTAVSLFSQSVYQGDGTGDWITTPDSADWTLGNGDFTIECFMRSPATSVDRPILGIYDGTGGAGSSWWLRHMSNNNVEFNGYGMTGQSVASSAVSPTNNIFYYYCVERAGATVRIYAGPLSGTASVIGSASIGTSTIQDSTSVLRIAGISNLAASLNGYLKELRVTKGQARYNNGSGYSVPTAAFPRGGLPFFTVNPSISGNSWVGQTLTCNPGTDTGATRTYQWKQDGTPISGETASTYVVVSGDISHAITCTITATNSNGSTPVTSAGVGPVTATDPLAVIRGSRLAYVSSSSVVLTLPTGSVAGDFMVIFAAHGYNVNTPAGWTSRSTLSGSNYNGAVFTKVLSSGDISTGSVTVTFGGSYNGTVIGVTFVGGTSGYRDIGASRNGAGASSRTVTSGGTPQSGDYLLLFGSARVNAAVTSSSLTNTLQSNTQSESSSICRFGLAVSSGAQSGTINYAGSPSGDYQAIIAIQP